MLPPSCFKTLTCKNSSAQNWNHNFFILFKNWMPLSSVEHKRIFFRTFLFFVPIGHRQTLSQACCVWQFYFCAFGTTCWWINGSIFISAEKNYFNIATNISVVTSVLFLSFSGWLHTQSRGSSPVWRVPLVKRLWHWKSQDHLRLRPPC